MKKILITVYERNGEYEYNTKVPLEVTEDLDLDEFVDDYAMNWYGCPEMAYKDGHAEYYLNGNEIYVSVTYEVITDKEYEVLRKYL